MTVIKGAYANNELQVYRYLTSTMQLTPAAACGVMANIYYESRFDQLAEGDGGNSFGLVQWNRGRKNNLINYCSKLNMSYKTVSGQMSFLYSELKSSAYKSSVLNTLTSVPNTAQGAYDAAYKFCTHFEIPANKYERAKERGNLASTSYWKAYGSGVAPLPTGVGFTTDVGSKIIEIARANLGKPYDSVLAYGPDSFSSSGFVYYCYSEAGYAMNKLSSGALYSYCSSVGRAIAPADVRVGDLLFYNISTSSRKEYHIAIANGEGGRIYCSKAEGKVVESKDSIGKPKYIFRILSDSETIPVGSGDEVAEDFTALTVIDTHAETIMKNLSSVQAEGFDYGYLIDLTHKNEGGVFKFYIPEFTETAGAQWEDVNIIGRSVSIKAYSHTNSRSISISLDLYAGAGLYDSSSEDVVSKLHKDLNFVKSLEYPDYTSAMVRPPATVQLILGSSIQLVGVVSDVSVEHLKPLDAQNRSMYAKLSFTVVQTAVNPPDYSDIKEGRYVLTSTSDVPSISQNIDTNAPKFTG